MYGKGKVGEAVIALCNHIGLEARLMDDEDSNETLLHDAEYIVVTPGIKESHFLYTTFSQKIISELDFLAIYKDHFSFRNDALYIGITWTNGKSTTSYIAYSVLSHLFAYDNSVMCRLGWNFSTPLSQLFLEILDKWLDKKRHVFVIESSSFMLAHTRIFCYAYAIWLNIARDHLDWHGTMDKYTQAKKNILTLSNHGFISASLLPVLWKSYDTVSVFADYDMLQDTHFLGKHNAENIWAVKAFYTAICDDLKLPIIPFDELICDVYPLAHRLSPIKKIWDITIIDDGICTSAAACKAALEAMDQKCILIAGWYDKGDDYTILRDDLSKKVSHIVLLGQVAVRIAEVWDDAHVSYTHVSQLSEAVHLAMNIAEKNGIQRVLFSPGAASLDMFKNVYDRIDQFVAIVESL